jgi:hypothetical protein
MIFYLTSHSSFDPVGTVERFVGRLVSALNCATDLRIATTDCVSVITYVRNSHV